MCHTDASVWTLGAVAGGVFSSALQSLRRLKRGLVWFLRILYNLRAVIMLHICRQARMHPLVQVGNGGLYGQGQDSGPAALDASLFGNLHKT
jgi:hypothetical protein